MPDDNGTILLCLDLEAGSEELARKAAGYASRLESPLHVLYVLPQSSGETEDAARGRLKELTDGALEGVDVLAVVVRRGCVEDHIMDYAAENAVDMVVLGHRHRARR
ncbi:MAG: universal stress protein, partial [Thermodesulfobacteriota bacterium]